MPLPIIPNTFRVAFDWTHSSDATLSATNVMHFQSTTLDAGDVLSAIAAAVDANMWRSTTTLASITTLTCWPLDGESLPEELATGGGASWTGSQSAGQIAPQVAAVVALRTAKRGKSYRGRVFIPWVAEAANDNGAVLEAQADLMDTAWEAFRSDLVTANCPLSVASYVLSTAEVVTSAVITRRTGTMRRRQTR